MSTIPGTIAGAAERFGPQPAIVDGDLRLTYAELGDRARRVGTWASERGVERVGLVDISSGGEVAVTEVVLRSLGYAG